MLNTTWLLTINPTSSRYTVEAKAFAIFYSLQVLQHILLRVCVPMPTIILASFRAFNFNWGAHLFSLLDAVLSRPANKVLRWEQLLLTEFAQMTIDRYAFETARAIFGIIHY